MLQVFGEVIISVFSVKFYQWNLFKFSKFTKALKRKEKKTHAAVNEKRKTEKICTLFYNRFFYEAL